MLSILNTHFPQLDAVDAVEFDSDYEENNGMWFKNSECGIAPDGLPLWDYYMTSVSIKILMVFTQIYIICYINMDSIPNPMMPELLWQVDYKVYHPS